MSRNQIPNLESNLESHPNGQPDASRSDNGEAVRVSPGTRGV